MQSDQIIDPDFKLKFKKICPKDIFCGNSKKYHEKISFLISIW